MHRHNGGKLPEQGLPTVAKSSAEQLGYRPAEILSALFQVRFRDCGPIKLQWQPLSEILLSGTTILWDLAGSNFTFDFVPQRGRFSSASWRDFVDLSFSVVDSTKLYRVIRNGLKASVRSKALVMITCVQDEQCRSQDAALGTPAALLIHQTYTRRRLHGFVGHV